MGKNIWGIWNILGKNIWGIWNILYLCTQNQNVMANIVFERKIYDKMLAWKQERQGKSALLIKGARRIGKSTIVRTFAEREYKSYILIDFSMASKAVTDLFEDLMNLDFIFLRLQSIYQVVLEKRKSVIIFDEVQLCPKARQAIKHLVADGRYDYIETGSLISIKKNVANIIIPSEETRLEMYPMDFEEFCWALGDKVTMPLLKQFFDSRIPLEAAHRETMRRLRLYMLVGGMPQAVKEYLETNNLSKTDAVKREILELYLDDFRKIDNSGRAAKLFANIPAQLNNNASRYQVASVLDDSERKNIMGILEEMKDSMVVNFAYHANDPNVGLALHSDGNFYKMFTADTGLFVTLAFWDKDHTENIIYEKLLSDKLNLVTIQLGENVRDNTTYEKDLEGLISYVHQKAPKAKIVLIGDFWDKKRNQMRQQAAENTNTPFADLAPIIGDKRYQSKEGTVCELTDGSTREVSKVEETHPGDEGMAYIAAQVIEKID